MNAISSAAAIVGTVGVTAIVGMGSAGSAPLAAAAFGSPQQVGNESPTIAYTVHDLQPSDSDVLTVPLTGNLPLAGDLWQATTTVMAVRGSAVPAMQFLNARNADGQNYRVLEQTFSPDLSASPLDQGRDTTGRIYFDVTGGAPTAVVYDDGVHTPITWTR
ncbi:MAG: DUF1942 domain-containing protein [Mycobacterium sp.]